MVTDQQVALLRQRQMEGKKQQTAAAMAGMSERSARKWQCGPLPSETKLERRWRTRRQSSTFSYRWCVRPPTRTASVGNPRSAGRELSVRTAANPSLWICS